MSAATLDRPCVGADKTTHPAVLDEQTFTQAWRDLYPRIVRYVSTWMARSGEAEDVACETFLKAWQHRASYNPAAGRLDTWLITIARRTAYDRLSYHVRRPVVDVDPLEVVLADDLDVAELVAQQVDAEVVAAMVRAAVAALTLWQRRVIALRYVQGMSGSEIAQATGLSVTAVKSLLHRGHLALRAALQVQLAVAQIADDLTGGA